MAVQTPPLPGKGNSSVAVAKENGSIIVLKALTRSPPGLRGFGHIFSPYPLTPGPRSGGGTIFHFSEGAPGGRWRRRAHPVVAACLLHNLIANVLEVYLLSIENQQQQQEEKHNMKKDRESREERDRERPPHIPVMR